MLRRVLPVATAAAALVAIPSTAWATAPQAPVENIFSAGYYGSTDFVLPDGRHVDAVLSEYRGASQNGWSGALSLYVTEGSCPDDPSCVTSDSWGTAILTEAQVAFSRNLDSASAVDVHMTLWTSPSSTDYLAEPTAEQVTVSIVFSGTGAVARDSSKGDMCRGRKPRLSVAPDERRPRRDRPVRTRRAERLRPGVSELLARHGHRRTEVRARGPLTAPPTPGPAAVSGWPA